MTHNEKSASATAVIKSYNGHYVYNVCEVTHAGCPYVHCFVLVVCEYLRSSLCDIV